MVKVNMAMIGRSGAAFCGKFMVAALIGSLSLVSNAAAQDEQGQQAQSKQKSGWFKICGKAPSATEEGKEVTFCRTQFDAVNPKTYQTVYAVEVGSIEGQDKESFVVQVPLGMVLAAPIFAKVDDNEPIRLQYTVCHVGGCQARSDATGEIINQLKNGEALEIGAVRPNGKPIKYRVALNNFGEAYTGEPVDNKKWAAVMQKRAKLARQARINMIRQARQRRQQQQQQSAEGQQ